MLSAPDVTVPFDTLFLGVHRFRWLATAADTGGAFSCCEILAVRGGEPPFHTHQLEDQAFFVLEGEVDVHVGEETVAAGPGDLVWLPRGVRHSFAIRSETVRLLEMSTPGGLEDAFLALSVPDDGTAVVTPDVPPSPEQIQALVEAFGRRDIAFELPPLPAG
jgi:quercetin dioxygenase-like cupin family protein